MSERRAAGAGIPKSQLRGYVVFAGFSTGFGKRSRRDRLLADVARIGSNQLTKEDAGRLEDAFAAFPSGLRPDGHLLGENSAECSE
jgi:hypothetical protein